MLKEVSCGTIIIKNKSVLLIRQNQGHISFPKGHVEEGETHQETALRETYEETGIKAKIISNKEYIVNYDTKEGINKNVIFFLAEVLEDGDMHPQECEIREVFWTPIDDAAELLTYDNMKNLWLEIRNDLKM
jgi:8-oxo-dGTP pyrophosphatase MutT (NUDIX family)